MTYPECGTTKSYHRHVREKTAPCRPCLDALSAYIRARSIRLGKTQNLPIPLGTLALLLRGPYSPMLRRHLGDEVSDAIIERFKRAGAA